ncbi:M15 family metallopeptidase [Pseudooceanicola sp. HF7]|uniref:M15 family metallopeptidase n=1 Tax=Pseudooceanicola sp. HF7 TaxID=2721560 RepID=UPI00142F76CF|nr:M15 family metallopeptidase [Pseudooceanicola sp. HF7]NIZ08983.1 M15 family metallopeptidase [Pseudooceanicola sp. HF7]
MTKGQIRVLQRKLAELSLYTGKIDGIVGNKTLGAMARAFAKLDIPLPPSFEGWNKTRRTTAFLQAYALSEGIEAGVVDGLWGPQTDFAWVSLEMKLATGKIRQFRDETPETIGNPGGFPTETRSQQDLVKFYGKPGTPDRKFQPPMVRVSLPWKMKLAWDKRNSRSFLWAHEKCADSLGRVLQRIDGAYSDAQKSELGIDLFGGDYAPRKMKGANRASLHSWGIAYDFDPERNGLDATRLTARLAQPDAIPFWEAWEAEGWYSLGRMRNFDFMHVQAAHRL